MPGQRQHRQPQPGRPPLGPLIQQHQGRLGQLHPGLLEQRPRLTQGEPQILRPELGQLPLQPQPVQAQPHVVPGGQHEPQLRRGPHQQQLQLPQRLRRAQLMHVIDHQPEPVIQCRQVLQQPFHDRPPVQIRRRRQLPHQPRARRRPAQRAQHRQPEPLRITLATCHRHPRGALREIRLGDPGPQQDRLPAPRRRRHHRHPRRLEPPEQPRTRNHPSRTPASGPAGPGLRSLARHHGPSSHDASQRGEPLSVQVRVSPARDGRVPNTRRRRRCAPHLIPM